MEVIDHRLFHHYFQPVFSTKEQEVLGYECLIRSQFVQNLGELFETASKENRLNLLDIQSVQLAIEVIEQNLNEFPDQCKFFLNIYPSTILCDEYLETLTNLLQNTEIPASRIVLEINESEPVKSLSSFHDTLQAIRQLGIQIALDDVGKGMSPFKRFLELKPDIIKIDRYFASELAESTFKQGIIRTISDYCVDEGITVILEGIEEPADLQKSIDIGIPYAQGFLLGKPKPLDTILYAHHLATH